MCIRDRCNHITQERKRYAYQDRIDTVKKNMRYWKSFCNYYNNIKYSDTDDAEQYLCQQIP